MERSLRRCTSSLLEWNALPVHSYIIISDAMGVWKTAGISIRGVRTDISNEPTLRGRQTKEDLKAVSSKGRH